MRLLKKPMLMKKNIITYILMERTVTSWIVAFEQVEIPKSITGEKYKLLKEI